MSKKIKLGVIGTGQIGKMHIENILSNCSNVEVKSVADIYMDSMKEWAGNLGIKNIFKDYKDILNDPEIDAVLICSSTNSHSDISIEAAKAGKHIFCEKPIDFDLNKIYQVMDVVKETGVKFQIGFNRRFDHNFKKVHDLVEEGKIGKPQIIKITSRDPHPPTMDYVKVSGGIFLDMTIHDFDMARYLSGSEVVEVFANGAVLVDPEIGNLGDIDTAIISLKFANDAIGVIDNSRKAVYGYDQRVEVFGSKGCAAASNDTPTTAVLSTIEGVCSDKPKYFFLERYKDAYIDELKDFFNNLLEDRKPENGVVDGLKPVLIGLAAKKSLETGKPVKVE